MRGVLRSDTVCDQAIIRYLSSSKVDMMDQRLHEQGTWKSAGKVIIKGVDSAQRLTQSRCARIQHWLVHPFCVHHVTLKRLCRLLACASVSLCATTFAGDADCLLKGVPFSLQGSGAGEYSTCKRSWSA